MDQVNRVLTINPGSASTRIGVFENHLCLLEKVIRHSSAELRPYDRVTDQYKFRQSVILEELHKEGINLSKFAAVCGRGGLLRPIEGGTYLVNELMLKDLRTGYNGQHASNLGGILAHGIANGLNIPAFIVDPVVVDEMEEVARLSGMPDLPRKSIFHALNQKAAGHRAAAELGKKYEEVNLIIAHMGGGITIGAHKTGKVIDVNNGLHGEGPFSAERAGTVPAGDLVAMCFSGKYDRQAVMEKLIGRGGLMGYLHTNDPTEVEERIRQGDEYADLIYQAMAYQVSKEIGSMAAVMSGKVDAVILTGGLADGKEFVSMISDRVNWVADVLIYPGENELQALAEGTIRVLKGEEPVKKYSV